MENAIQHRDWSRSRLNGEIVITWHFDQVPVVKPYLVGGLILFSLLFSNSTYIYFFSWWVETTNQISSSRKNRAARETWSMDPSRCLSHYVMALIKTLCGSNHTKIPKVVTICSPSPTQGLWFLLHIYIYQAKKGTVYSSFFVSSASHNFSNIQVQ